MVSARGIRERRERGTGTGMRMYWARREKQGPTHALDGVCHDGKPPGFLREAGQRKRGKFFPQAPGTGLRRREQYIRIPFPPDVGYAVLPRRGGTLGITC